MIVSIPKPLREKLGDEGSESFIEMMNQLEENQTNAVLALSEQRFEKTLTRELADFKIEINARISDLRDEVFGEIQKLREEVFGEIHKLRNEVFEEIHKQRADNIKWMFLFWVGQTGVLAGILLAFLR